MDRLLVLAQNAGDALAWGGGMMAVMILVGIIFLAVCIWALVDAIQNPALDGTMRIVWVLVIVIHGRYRSWHLFSAGPWRSVGEDDLIRGSTPTLPYLLSANGNSARTASV